MRYTEHRFEMSVFLTLVLFLILRSVMGAVDALLVTSIVTAFLLVLTYWHGESFIPILAMWLSVTQSFVVVIVLGLLLIAAITVSATTSEADWRHRYKLWQEELGYSLGAIGLVAGYYLAMHEMLLVGVGVIVVSMLMPIVSEDPRRLLGPLWPNLRRRPQRAQ
jgi:hypothetical protein